MIRLTNRLFGTHPAVAHCPGPPHRSWDFFLEAALAMPPRAGRCDDLTILTWNSGKRRGKPLGVLEKSLERQGVEAVVLGREIAEWRNIRKLRLTAEALEHVSTPYVMGIDSSDAVLIDEPALLVERFREHFTCDLLFNATGSRCWPELPEFVRFESSLPMAAAAQGRHWLNSGVWIGTTPFCRRYFAALADEAPVEGFPHSDQAVIKRTWPDWYPQVQLDYLCVLFQWFNEERTNLVVERSLEARQRQLVELLQPFGSEIEGAEVGVFDGFTSDALLRKLPGLHLWMVDPWKPYEGNSVLGNLDQAAFDRARSHALWWTEHARERRFVLQESSQQAASRFAEAALDFVFIDANHLYEHVRNDLRAWWPKLRPGGLLTGHDYGTGRDAEGWWGVRRAVDEFAREVGRDRHVGDDGVWWIFKAEV